MKTLDEAQTQQDLQHGQIVIVMARWILIATGLFLSVFLPGPIEELRLEIGLIFGLSVVNFFLHTQLLRRRPVSRQLVYTASAADLTVVSLLLLTQGGFASHLYVLYFPALLALSVAFPPVMTLAYAGATVTAYGLLALTTATDLASDGTIIVTRVLMLAAVAFCGYVYWRIEHGRRQAAAETRRSLEQELRADGRHQRDGTASELTS